jgi:hypothetical protein
LDGIQQNAQYGRYPNDDCCPQKIQCKLTAAVGAKAPTRSEALEILICVTVYQRKAEDSVTALQSTEVEPGRKFGTCLLV